MFTHMLFLDTNKLHSRKYFKGEQYTSLAPLGLTIATHLTANSSKSELCGVCDRDVGNRMVRWRKRDRKGFVDIFPFMFFYCKLCLLFITRRLQGQCWPIETITGRYGNYYLFCLFDRANFVIVEYLLGLCIRICN